MERVKTLTDKLQDQLAQNASPDQLLTTVEMLRSELEHLKLIQPKKEVAAVAVHIAPVIPVAPVEREPELALPEEKTVEVLQVDEAELEAELEEIKRTAKEKSSIGSQNKPTLLFDPIEDTPTLTHQPNIPEEVPEEKPVEKPVQQVQPPKADSPASLNDRLKESKTELFDALKEAPIRDLRKAIGINDKFLFVNELFRGDDTMYERSIKTINGFSIYPEAEYWIKRELKLKLGWDDRHEVVKQFDQLVKRRFL
ncbi:MAG: hypothetical protein EOO06_03585 [Chitinophagaceae bacterium]|nr:MAG: hypothetical protein EOO06_03585 [Chitinophagaceae bacterium]